MKPEIIKGLEYYKELELRYEQLLEETSNLHVEALKACNATLTAALNRIGMLGKSELAYTSEFTERVTSIVNKVLQQEDLK